MIDVHVHLAALPDGKNGCYMSPKMRNGWLVKTVAKAMQLPLEDVQKTNQLYLDRLLQAVRSSQHVQHVVILAMDGAYTPDGELDKVGTDFLISNDYVLETARQYPELFKAGVSISPKRRDAVAELERCAAAGAVLVKVLPNAQDFDPSDPAYRPFWKTMARLKIPLLSHVGYEFSLIGKDQSRGDPAHLRLALDEGVTVIAAHGVSFGLVFYEKYWNTFQLLVKTYPNFYWDASALSLFNRVGMLLRIARHPELHSRMVFGTDYPLPSFAYPALLAGKWGDYFRLRKIDNPFDRHYLLLKALGFTDAKNPWNFEQNRP